MPWWRWGRRARAAVESADITAGPAAMIAGRLRAVGVPYMLPRDNEEINRLDFQHAVLRFTLQGNYAAPIGEPTSILDVGTGTGRWAREMAQLFPRAAVVGLDIAPPPADDPAAQHAAGDPPPANYSFVPGNVLEGLPYPDASFDFVHARLLVGAIPADRWPFVVGEMARVTRPGGWIESVETPGARAGGPHLELLYTWIAEMCARRGVDPEYVTHLSPVLSGAGLAQVAAREVRVPMGAHGQRAGTLLATDAFAFISSVAGVIVAQGIASATTIEETLAAARADVNSSQFRAYTPFYITYGQRIR